MSRYALPVLIALAAGPAALAHPLPNLRYDRAIHVRLSPGGVTVRYSVEMNDWTMVLDGKNLVTVKDTLGLTGSLGYATKYAEKKSPHIADGLRATLDGADLPFRVERPAAVEPQQDHLRLTFHLRADWSPGAGAPHTFQFEDQNFEDRAGAVTLTLDRTGHRIDLVEVDEPTDLRGKSRLDLTPEDERRSRRASAVFSVGQPAIPHPEPTAPEPTPAETPPSPKPTVFESVRDRGLHALFDTNIGLGVMLLLAALFGAAHAFTPGHGKTMVAAYLVGERGTVKHASVLGLVATVAHTGSVIVLAVVIYTAYGNEPPASAQGWLTLIGGLLIAGVGLWLFLQRVRGRADHVHLFSGHDHQHHDHDNGQSHSHDHGHHHHGPPPDVTSNFGWVRVILLGLGGGIIPCWDAVLLFLVALTRGKVGLAIPLLIAFSAGLAAVLIGLGITVVLANRAGGRRFGESRWFRGLPVVSAVVLMGLGVWFARDGFQALAAAEKGVAPAASRP